MASAPFLTYLTVFKSRLGLANVMLQVTGLVHQPDAAIMRKLRALFDRAEDLDLSDPRNFPVFEYLKEKRLVSRQAGGSGRYSAYGSLELVNGEWQVRNRRGQSISTIRVYVTDLWLANPDVASTIGVPTPDNVRETFEFPFQLGLVSKSTNTWTASGQLTSGLRSRFAKLLSDAENPLLLGVEAASLLRQVVAADGRILAELIGSIGETGADTVSRDQIAAKFPVIVERAVKAVKELKLSPPVVREAVEFQQTIRATVTRRERLVKRGQSATAGPGLLEHRVSPRLEWLTDLGYLSKEGLPKNAFEYRITDSLPVLLADLVDHADEENWADEVALHQWSANPAWSSLRQQVATRPWPASLREAYDLMRRRIGPAPLREVAFALGLLSIRPLTFARAVAEIIEFAQTTKGATLSGGRYKRTPENIFLSDSLIESA